VVAADIVATPLQSHLHIGHTAERGGFSLDQHMILNTQVFHLFPRTAAH
jgi:hypothetical protein